MKEEEEEITKNPLEDYELIQAALKNSPKAYKELLRRYRKSVYYLIFKMLRNPDDSEDLTQETFAKAFRSLDKYNSRYAFSTWIFRIATNSCIDFIRRRKIHTVSLINEFETEEGIHLAHDVRDTALGPNEQLLKKQRQDILGKALKTLPEKFQQLVELRYFQELSYEEMAVLLELPVGTVKAQLFRARELLIEALKGIQDQV